MAGHARYDELDWLDTFDVSSPCIFVASSLSNSAARQARLDVLDTSNVSCRDVTSQVGGIWAYALQ